MCVGGGGGGLFVFLEGFFCLFLCWDVVKYSLFFLSMIKELNILATMNIRHMFSTYGFPWVIFNLFYFC